MPPERRVMTIRNVWICQLIVVAGILSQNLAPLNASTITYSWSGTLVLSNGASADPWGIGGDGVSFVMSTTVDVAAQDENSVQTAFAVFVAANSRLWVDGEEALLVSAPLIDFTDSTDLLDAVTMAGVFSKGGQTVEFSTVAALSPLAYTFNSLIETPPPISSTTTRALGTDVFQPYVALVPAGTLVSVVPEPTAIAIGAFLGSIFAFRRRGPTHAHWLDGACACSVLARADLEQNQG